VYVVDSSFFLSATAMNPALTTIAKAPRAADHLAVRRGACHSNRISRGDDCEHDPDR
jgi:choline dehydrogenase-like flavoprotein